MEAWAVGLLVGLGGLAVMATRRGKSMAAVEEDKAARIAAGFGDAAETKEELERHLAVFTMWSSGRHGGRIDRETAIHCFEVAVACGLRLVEMEGQAPSPAAREGIRQRLRSRATREAQEMVAD